MISSTIFLATVINAEELTAAAPVLLDPETDGSQAELVLGDVGGDPFNDERRLTSGGWYWWRCNNGDYVKSKYVCDRVCDCTDCSDEWTAIGTHAHCPYMADDAAPLPYSAARDAARGELNTRRLEDDSEELLTLEALEEPEQRRVGSGVALPPPVWYWWGCANGYEWIKSKYVCDGVCDCDDCSDEYTARGTKAHCPYSNGSPLPWSAARAASRGEINDEQQEQRRLIPGQCRCNNGSTGMLTGQGCLDRHTRQRCDTPYGQCTCNDGSTGMQTDLGCLDRTTLQKCDVAPGGCTCNDGSSGMLTAQGCLDRNTFQKCDVAPGGCTCSDGSSGMFTAQGCIDRRTRQKCDLMPGQCNCSDGTTGFLAAGGDCVCDETRLFGR